MVARQNKGRSTSHCVGADSTVPHTGTEGGSRTTNEVGEYSSDSAISHSRENNSSSQLHTSCSPSQGIEAPIFHEQTPAAEPPVTKTTLSELDVNKIVNNPKLRHDINFDPELHFRPNLDGDKGRRKQQKANHFWEIMRNQLQEFLMDPQKFENDTGDIEWALPATLRAIREILETLVPQRDRATVQATFHVDLLMQQFRKRVANMIKLSNWLSQLLKCHCAPMRDEWVDQMVDQFSAGDKDGNVAMLTEGMRNLLGILEAMKLDVANHQIRCLRPLLIDDTVPFEQKFFMKKIEMGRVDIDGADIWFKNASSIPDVVSLGTKNCSQGNTWDFMKALVNLTLPSKSSQAIPHTFLFDEERLLKLRADMQDLINLEICMYLFRSLDTQSKAQETHTYEGSATSSPNHRPTPTEGSGLVLPHHFATTRPLHVPSASSNKQRWSASIEEDRCSSSASSSPFSSPASRASTPETYPPTPLYLSAPVSDSASRVRSGLLAILSSTSAPDKWNHLAPALALQILRSTTSPLTQLPQFEVFFAQQISNPTERIYQEAEQRVLHELFPVLRDLVDKYTPLSSLQIFEAATAPKVVPLFGVSPAPHALKDEVTEIATRIAHIGILHWRVWAPLAYLVEQVEEDNQSVQTPMERAKSVG